MSTVTGGGNVGNGGSINGTDSSAPDGNPSSSSTSALASSTTSSSTTSTGISPGKGTKQTSTSTISSSSSTSGVSTGAIAGAAAGCLIAGLILGGLIALVFLRKKFHRHLQAADRRSELEKEDSSSASPKNLLYATSYSEPSREVELEDARKRIKTLEAERNAASAFGDTLDGQSEQELLDSPNIGIKTFNEKLHQLAMAISVSSNADHATKSTTPPPQGLGDGLAALETFGRERASQDIEAVVRHVINSIVFEKLCVPFCFIAEPQMSLTVSRINKRVEKQYDQAMAARWRIMSHKTLRESSEDPSGQAILSTVHQTIFNALVEALLWANVESSISSASNLVSKSHPRIVELTKCISTLVRTLREEMTTANYEIDRASLKSLTSSLGLSTRSKGSPKKVRVILETA